MKVLGAILMIIGLLLLAVAGLCTLIFGTAFLSEVFSVENPALENVALVLIYGGVPMIVGALIAWGGYALWRSGNAPPPPPPPMAPPDSSKS